MLCHGRHIVLQEALEFCDAGLGLLHTVTIEDDVEEQEVRHRPHALRETLRFDALAYIDPAVFQSSGASGSLIQRTDVSRTSTPSTCSEQSNEVGVGANSRFLRSSPSGRSGDKVDFLTVAPQNVLGTSRPLLVHPVAENAVAAATTATTTRRVDFTTGLPKFRHHLPRSSVPRDFKHPPVKSQRRPRRRIRVLILQTGHTVEEP